MATIPGLAGPGAPFPQWTVVENPGGVMGGPGEVTNAVTKALVEATAWPSAVLFFTSEQDAANFIKTHGGGTSSIPVVTPLINAGGGVLNNAGQLVQNASDMTGVVKGIFGYLTQPDLWVRVLEIGVGLIILYVGLKAATEGTPVGAAASTATRTVKKAVTLGKVPVRRHKATVRKRAIVTRQRTVTAQRRQRAVERQRVAASRRYQVTERTPISGEMGGTRTVRYHSRSKPS